MTTNSAEIAAARLRACTGWQETLAAAIDAFEMVLRVARQDGWKVSDLVDAFLATGCAAADGLEALAAIPVPALGSGIASQDDLAEDAECAADAVAGLAAVLGEKLDHVWAQLPDGQPRAACEDAARSAWDIHDLMTADDRDVR